MKESLDEPTAKINVLLQVRGRRQQQRQQRQQQQQQQFLVES